jgi:3-oxoisoapionate kinase
LPAEGSPERTSAAERIAVVSGSVSEVTAAQIGWAEAHGFGLVPIDASCVTDPARMAAEKGSVIAEAVRVARSGRSVLVHSARGPGDPRVVAYRAALAGAGLSSEDGNRRIGEMLGDVLAAILRETGLGRAVIAGGDTSSHAARKLGLRALTALAETVPGAALCEGHLRSGSRIEIALKGGQMGTTDYFGRIRDGGGPDPIATGRG